MPLDVTLLDLTEWASPYVLLEDDEEDVGNLGGLIRVGHTRDLAQWREDLCNTLCTSPCK